MTSLIGRMYCPADNSYIKVLEGVSKDTCLAACCANDNLVRWFKIVTDPYEEMIEGLPMGAIVHTFINVKDEDGVIYRVLFEDDAPRFTPVFQGFGETIKKYF